MYRKGFSVATIGIFLASILATFTPAAAVPPAPANYFLSEYAWLKEDGLSADTWAQYNNTGWNRLNLTYKFSKVNVAYVVRSSATADDFNVTFILYHNSSATSGFNSTGHLFPGSMPNATRTVPAISTQTAGLYTYHLFITTFDPSSIVSNPVGIWQVRINETGPGSGSSWTSPMGNPNVQWMFFFVPTATPNVFVTDQLGRSQPFFLDGDSPTTQYNVTMIVDPPGNATGATQATIQWIDTDGSTVLWQKSDRPIYYVPGVGWATQWVVAANTSFTPFNATDPYWVRVQMGAFSGAAQFFVLSTLWIDVNIVVEPIMDQWFDPASFRVTFTAVVNTGVANNPYQDVYNVTLQFWDKVHVDLLPSGSPDGVPEWYGGQPGDPAGNPVWANLSWNITGYPVVPGSSYTYSYQKMIPQSYIDNTTTSLGEFFGWYAIASQPSTGMFPAVIARTEFYVDDPIEGYTSLEKASTTAVGIWEQKTGTVWVNVEYDPTYLRARQHVSDVYADKKTNITWYYPSPPTLLKPPGNDQTTMTQDPAWPSDQYWAFSTASVNSSFTIGTYQIIANATTDTGTVVRELITWNVVYRALYLEIWPKWEEYEPCMKKSIVGKTYYLDENDNEVPVEWGFYVFKLVDPNGVVYTEPLDGAIELWEMYEPYGNPGFPWTYTELNPSETESLGAIWDEIPSDAELGTWTVYAMALGADFWDDNPQTIDGFSFQGPVTTTFEVVGQDLHLAFDEILDAIDENSNVTWEMIDDVMASLADLETKIDDLTDDEIATIISKLDDVLAAMVEQDAVLASIDDYVREIRALTQRIDRWRTDMAEDLADHFAEVLFEVAEVNDNINSKWTELGDLWQITFYGVSERDPRSLSYKISQARAATVDAVVTSLAQIVDKMDKVEASLGAKIVNVLNAVTSEVGGLDDSLKASIAANIEYVVANLRAKIDDSEAGLSSKIASAADGLHGKFAGVISEIGHVADKVDTVEAKLGGVETNVKDKVDSVDASVGTKLLVAIILIVIVLILVLLPIVAPGFRMKE